MEKLIYKDKVGNKLFSKFIKSRNIEQYFGKNSEGEILNPHELRKMFKMAGKRIKVPREKGIHRVKEYFRKEIIS